MWQETTHPTREHSTPRVQPEKVSMETLPRISGALLRLLVALTPQPEASFKEHWLPGASASLGSASAKGHQLFPLRTPMPVQGWPPLCSLISAQPHQGPQMLSLLEQPQSHYLRPYLGIAPSLLVKRYPVPASYCTLTSAFLPRHATHTCTTHSIFHGRLIWRTLAWAEPNILCPLWYNRRARPSTEGFYTQHPPPSVQSNISGRKAI